MARKIPKPVCIDFETHGIQGRPSYPPVPVGVSIKHQGQKAKYYAWGHPTGNNCSLGEAMAVLAEVWATSGGILCQNGKFDVDVAEIHMDMNPIAWDRVHDTLFLLFLDDPNQTELGLKPSAHRLLGLPPEEQDEVADWLIAHQPVDGVKISRSKTSEHYFAKYIAYAPGDLVGRYANGDVERTERLFKLLYPKIVERGMLEAYERERELARVLLEVERHGIRVDLERLRGDVINYQSWQRQVDAWLLKALKAPADLNLNSGEQLMAAMVAAEKVDTALMPLTKTGKYQTNKEALLLGVKDKVLLGMLKYRAQLSTCLGTFMEPWLETAEQSDGLIYTTWSQTKSAEGASAIGTRTGRLSSSPNFQNIPKEFTPIWAHEAKGLPRCPLTLPPLPQVRDYVVPMHPDHALIDRDFCFGPETDVLTDRGFVRFEELTSTDLVAQWSNGEVSYAKPKAYQVSHFDGELVHIVGERSTDLLVTPNHQCLLVKEHQTVFMRADEYRLGHFQQIHAGVSVGQLKIEHDYLRLVAAIQADAAVKSSAIVWKLKKIRKIERLQQLLDRLKIVYRVSTPPSTVGYSIIYVDFWELPKWVDLLIDLVDGKTFRRTILQTNPEARLAFLLELAHWDGRRGTHVGHWSYFSTNEKNAELVQEVAVVTGLRSVLHTQMLPSGKVFKTVALRTKYLTWTQTFTTSRVPYAGPTYCVTMPAGTVVIRRNGRVAVTGNSQQEPRILAHFDGGTLMERYLADPWIDFHDFAKAELEKGGKVYDRKPVKNINLGLIYGMGTPKLAAKNDMPVGETKELKEAILKLYPGLKEMYKDMKWRARANQPIRTWGGREYYCEPSRIIDGRTKSFDYKMVNTLIQGSAGDCTKEVILRYWRAKKPDEYLLFNVHDQLTASVPLERIKSAMEILRVSMEGVKFDVPMLSEGSWSTKSWATLIDYDKKGVLLYGNT